MDEALHKRCLESVGKAIADITEAGGHEAAVNILMDTLLSELADVAQSSGAVSGIEITAVTKDGSATVKFEPAPEPVINHGLAPTSRLLQ